MKILPLAFVGAVSLLAPGCADTSDADPTGTEQAEIKSGESCGNGTCGPSESCKSCPRDCGVCPFCGDGACTKHETCSNCPADCGPCTTYCGDQFCGGTETCTSCPKDCGQCTSTCGNGICGAGETCSTCAADCGACPPVCGDQICDPGESCSSCPSDCGTCPPVCGDLVCDPGESCTNCPSDCGSCPPDSGVPDAGGGCVTPADCPASGSDCLIATCVSGVCAYPPLPVGAGCGITQCTPTSACVFDGDPICDTTGQQQAQCTSSTCNEVGQCVPGNPVNTTLPCSRVTQGAPCGTMSCVPTTGCVFEGNAACDETGTQQTSCTSPTCVAGSCTPVTTTGSASCTRTTDGDICGSTAVGCPIGYIQDRCCSTSAGFDNNTCTVPCGGCEPL